MKTDYFAAALDMLASSGFGALKLRPLCKKLRVTTGSFYNHFDNWDDFKRQFLAHWWAERTVEFVKVAESETDPARRLDVMRALAVSLPHGAEAAIRVWSTVDPDVRSVQEAVDNERMALTFGAMSGLIADPVEAERYARWGLSLLVGFEQLNFTHDPGLLDWSLRQIQFVLEARGLIE